MGKKKGFAIFMLWSWGLMLPIQLFPKDSKKTTAFSRRLGVVGSLANNVGIDFRYRIGKDWFGLTGALKFQTNEKSNEGFFPAIGQKGESALMDGLLRLAYSYYNYLKTMGNFGVYQYNQLSFLYEEDNIEIRKTNQYMVSSGLYVDYTFERHLVFGIQVGILYRYKVESLLLQNEEASSSIAIDIGASFHYAY